MIEYGKREEAIRELNRQIHEKRRTVAEVRIQQKLKPFVEIYGDFEGRDKFESFAADFLTDLLEYNTEINEGSSTGAMEALIWCTLPEHTLSAYVSPNNSWMIQLKVKDKKLQTEITNGKLVEVVLFDEEYNKAQVIRRW